MTPSTHYPQAGPPERKSPALGQTSDRAEVHSSSTEENIQLLDVDCNGRVKKLHDEIAELDARCLADMAAEEAARPAWDDHEATIADCVDHAADELLAIVRWHGLRADERELERTPGRAALVALFEAVKVLQQCLIVAPDEEIDAAVALVRHAADEAKHASGLSLRQIPTTSTTINADAVNQFEELDSSPLRCWLRVLLSVEHCRRVARQNPARGGEMAVAALKLIAFTAPIRAQDLT